MSDWDRLFEAKWTGTWTSDVTNSLNVVGYNLDTLRELMPVFLRRLLGPCEALEALSRDVVPLNLWLTNQGLYLARADAIRYGQDSVHRTQVKRRGHVVYSTRPEWEARDQRQELWVFQEEGT